MAWWNDIVGGGGDSVWGDTVSQYTGSDGSVWGGLADAFTGDSGGGWWDTVVDWFGSDSGNGQSWGSNIFGAMLGGLGGAADAYLNEENIEAMGREQRRTLDYTASLEDYYKQNDKLRKRRALDTYGQFSLMDRWAPNYTAAPNVTVPNKPST